MSQQERPARRSERPKSFVTYGIKDPQSGAFVYVGQTGDFEKRQKSHLRIRRQGPYNNGPGYENIKTKMFSWVSAGVTPEFVVLEVCSDDPSSKASETAWIKRLSDEGQPLLNRWREHRAHIKSTQNPQD